jgi:hypothetical protein
VKHPRREHAVRALGGERRLEPVAARLEDLAKECDRAGPSQPPHGSPREGETGRRPELGAEDAERELGVREEPVEHARPLGAELLRVFLRRAREEGGAAVRECGRRRQHGVQVLEAAHLEIRAELGVRGAADPERMPGAEDVVEETRLRQLLGLDRAAEPVVALEHADAPVCAREQCGAGE